METFQGKYVFIVKKTESVPFRLSSIRQWTQSNSFTWAHDLWLHSLGTKKVKSVQQVKQGAL